MSKNKLKTKSAHLQSKHLNTDEVRDTILLLQTKYSRLQESLDCLFGFLIKKNIIEQEEFTAYLANKFMYKSDVSLATKANLQGMVSITYYDKESMEIIQ
ncbi:MAG: hypothetical protein AB2L12_08755 [Smithellaceae bacterium]